MRKPSLRRKNEATPPMLAQAPAPAKKSLLRRKKEPTPQALAQGPAPDKKRRLGGAGRLLALLAKPFKKVAGLQGKARIVVWGLLAVIVVVGLLTLRGGRDDEALVRDALARYEQASADKDVQTLCDELFASSFVRQTASSGLPCEVALRTALEDVQSPTLEVLSVEVNGDRALARVRGVAAGQVPGESNYTLVREGDAWRILPPRSGALTP